MSGKALVLGLARSGMAVSELLISRGWDVLACDAKAREAFGGSLHELERMGVHLALGKQQSEGLLENVDLVVISPGIAMTHPLVLRAQERGIEVIGEVECAYRESMGTLVAITGTNGKTTTAALLGEIYKNAGRRTHVVGNIGTPYSAAVSDIKPGDMTVCEISSFMMESTSKFHPHVSAVLNISEDHLNRHGTMEKYIALKERIFENETCEDYVVLNRDDMLTRDMAARSCAQPVWFSTHEEVEYGAFVRDGDILFGKAESARVICSTQDVYIPGEHNLSNALAATAMAMVTGVPAPVIRYSLRTFKGVEHRIEFVRELNGVRFINDSKGTNVDASIRAIRAMMRPTVLILGGHDKHADFTPLCSELAGSMIESVVLIGETAKQLEAALQGVGFERYEHAGYDFERAVKRAFELAQAGGNVLLSPSCASFDMFPDYEARGRSFKELVNRLCSG